VSDNCFAAYVDAVTSFVTSRPLLKAWPAYRRALLEQLSEEPPWTLALPGISCLAVGGAGDDATPVAAAWATLYRAGHILDTVQDGDTILGTGFHTPATAINFAIGSIFAAFRFLDGVPYPGGGRRISALFSEAGFHSSLGQHLDLVQHLEDMPADEALEAYWRAVIAKSGSIFRAATAGGAAAGTDSKCLIASLGDFGNCLGVILQVLDDCRDVLAGSDVAKCEVSLPLLLFSMSIHNDRTEWNLLDRGTFSREELFNNLHKADVSYVVTDVLLEWRRRALDSLKPLEHPEGVAMLEGIVDHILTGAPSLG